MILGIDPGTRESAYVAFAPQSQRIVAKGKIANAAIALLLLTLPFSTLAIEVFQSYGMPVGNETFDTLIWIGRFREIVERRSSQAEPVTIWPVFRKQVVMHHTRKITGNDSAVRTAMVRRFGAPGMKANPGPTYGVTHDCWSALAIASFVSDRVSAGAAPPVFPSFAKIISEISNDKIPDVSMLSTRVASTH